MVGKLRPFTVGEDAVLGWLTSQDDIVVADIVPMQDGRDFVVFQRQYTKQSFHAATVEAQGYLLNLISAVPKQHVTRDTRLHPLY
jgi:hypothetical protein